MKELHFLRVGRMHIATEGTYRFVLHSVSPDVAIRRWSAEVHNRNAGPKRKPLAQETFATKSEAIDWLARYRQPEVTP